MAVHTRSSFGQVPAVDYSVDEESRRRLEQLCHDCREQLDSIASEFAGHMDADPASRSVLGTASMDADGLQRLVRRWLDWVLRGATALDESALEIALGLRKLAEVPQSCLLDCITRARSRVSELASLSGDDRPGDLGVASVVERLMDAQLREILLVHRRELLDQLEVNRRLASMGHLVASIGHELRNPLQAIETSAYLLSQRVAGCSGNDHTIEKHINKIRHQVAIATNTVTVLLELARDRAPRKTRFELLPMLEEVRASVACPTNVRVELDVLSELVAHGDRDQLRIVVYNLLANAVHSVGVSGTVTVEAHAAGDGTSLSVSDDGSGIAPSEQLHLFELMHTTRPNGCGIGLPLCRRIAVAHGGTLSLEPSERGARFHLWIPG